MFLFVFSIIQSLQMIAITSVEKMRKMQGRSGAKFRVSSRKSAPKPTELLTTLTPQGKLDKFQTSKPPRLTLLALMTRPREIKLTVSSLEVYIPGSHGFRKFETVNVMILLKLHIANSRPCSFPKTTR